jgi:uncharacterized protein (DUF2062 family)
MPGRRTLSNRVRRLLYELRTEGSSRRREAWAIGLGLFIGCSPFIGLHLVMCWAVGWLFGLNRVKLYLAANLINPLILPFVLFAEVQSGALLRRGYTYSLSPHALSSIDPWRFGGDLLVGSLVIGGIVGAAGGWLVYRSRARAYRDPDFTRLVDAAADRYLNASITAWEFARAKLRRDPVYREIVTSGLLPADGSLIDVGCGQGLLLAIVAQACADAQSGRWPIRWAAPPARIVLTGIEVRPRLAALARAALGEDAAIVTADATTLRVDRASVAALIDVLHLIDLPAQEALVSHLAAAIEPGGMMLLREADAAAGWRFQAVRFGNRLVALLTGRWRTRFAFRAASDWCALLERHGLAAELREMGTGTPFGNVLVVGKRDAASRERLRVSCRV